MKNVVIVTQNGFGRKVLLHGGGKIIDLTQNIDWISLFVEMEHIHSMVSPDYKNWRWGSHLVKRTDSRLAKRMPKRSFKNNLMSIENECTIPIKPTLFGSFLLFERRLLSKGLYSTVDLKA